MKRSSEGKTLEHIISEMIDMVEVSKEDIFAISQEAHIEHTELLEELGVVKEEVIKHIDAGDQLDKKVRLSRHRLSMVSKNFNQHSEKEIQAVYESTHSMQTELIVLRQKEKSLRERRDELERRLIVLNDTVEKATSLANKTSVILTYLTDDFSAVNDFIEDAKEKHEFSLKILEAQEEERKKISRELHDGPAQMLANIILHSEIIDRVYRSGDIELAMKEVKSVREMIRSSLYEVRHIIYDLRPMALDDLGLVPTIKKYIATTSDYHQVKIQFTYLGLENRLHQEYEIAFFRLVQESLQNAIKHAESTLIKVKLEIGARNLALVVEDNGRGFDATLKSDKSFGLVGMRERVEMLEGKMTINSVLGKGTRVFINVPYHS